MTTPGEPSLIPLCEPHLGGNEWTYVKDCLDTGWVSSVGSYVERFEKTFASWIGARRAVATVNGTSALHVALQVSGVQPGDEVLVSTLTFIAPVNAIRYLGAHPVLMDAEPLYGQIDPAKVADFLHTQCTYSRGELRNKSTGRPVTAILPVHILGHPVNLRAITEIARRYELRVIEDASEGLGATVQGTPVGTMGALGCFSFNGNKLLTTGGGGMIVTDDDALADKARHLTTQAKLPGPEFIHDRIGYNYRLTNVAAALGCAQLERIERHLERKRAIARKYREAFAEAPGILCMDDPAFGASAWWLFTTQLTDGRHIQSRELMRRLTRQHIECRPLWEPMHRSAAHRHCQSWHCDVADRLHRGALSLPSSVGLTDEQQTRVVDAVIGGLQALTG